MGILENGLLGGFRNKVGPSIGRKFRGKDIIVGPYRESTKGETEAEIKQQNRFAMLNHFLNNLKLAVRPGFKQYAKKMSAINAAHSFNYGRAFIEDEQGLKLNFPSLVYSRGNVSMPNCPSVVVSATDRITITWLPEQENQYTRSNDLATFVIWMEKRNKPLIFIDKVQRSALEFSLSIPNDMDGERLHCYMSFNSTTAKLVGSSIYVGAVLIG